MVKILRTNIKNDENNTRVNLFYLLCFLVFFLVFLKIYFFKKKDYDKKKKKQTPHYTNSDHFRFSSVFIKKLTKIIFLK